MEARAHPRFNMRLKTELICVNTRTCHQRFVRNISLGGMYVAGSACGNPGMEISVLVTPMSQPIEQSRRFPARIVRTGSNGFALQFHEMGSRDCDVLQNLMQPRWDGRNVFDGLLIVAAREHVMSLSECLRLTSVICDRYRRHCAVTSCAARKSDTKDH